MDWNNVFPDVPENFHKRVIKTLESQTKQPHFMKEVKIMKKKRFVKVAAVVLVLISTISVGAYALMTWNPKLAEIFGVNTEQQEQLLADGTTVAMNHSVSDNGLTIEAVQTIGDKNSVYILLDITAPDDILLSGENVFTEDAVRIKGTDDFSASSGFMSDIEENGYAQDDEQSLTNHGYYSIRIYNDEQADLNGKTISLSFRDLLADSGKQGYYTIVEGSWELSWKLEYEDHTSIFDINESINVGDHEIFVDSIEISPLSMSVNVSGDGLKELGSSIKQGMPLFTANPVLEDGTLFDHYGGGRHGFTDLSYETHIYRDLFDTVLDIEQVRGVSLRFFGLENEVSIEIPLNQ